MGMGGISETDGARPQPSMEPRQHKIMYLQDSDPFIKRLKIKAKTNKTCFCCDF